MKRLIAAGIACIMLTGCGNSSSSQESESSSQLPDYILALANDGYDCDLTQLNSNMMYGQIFDMVNNYEPYMGLSVRVKGNFQYYKDPAGKDYFSVFIPDAAQCCNQGIEFVLKGEHTYPDDYPQIGDEITVTGTFNAYDEYHAIYCQLLDAEIVSVVPAGGNENETQTN